MVAKKASSEPTAKREVAQKKMKIEQLGVISTQGNTVEDKVRELVDWVNSQK